MGLKLAGPTETVTQETGNPKIHPYLLSGDNKNQFIDEESPNPDSKGVEKNSNSKTLQRMKAPDSEIEQESASRGIKDVTIPETISDDEREMDVSTPEVIATRWEETYERCIQCRMFW